jgi:hypothetical protein
VTSFLSTESDIVSKFRVRGVTQSLTDIPANRPLLTRLSFSQDKFTIMNPNSNGTTKALYIGINYALYPQMNAQGVGPLGGCHNDVMKVKQYAESQGFSPNNCKILMDDGKETALIGIHACWKRVLACL